MRLFIAINFDDETKNKILDVSRRLKEFGSGNFTKPDNLHLTLAFLGEVETSDIQKVKDAMDNVYIPKLNLTFSKVGIFNRDSKTVWIGLKENEELNILERSLVRNLKAQGIYVDSKKFKPHITLCREMNAYIDLDAIKFKEFSFEMDKINLMVSSRDYGKLKYDSIYERKYQND